MDSSKEAKFFENAWITETDSLELDRKNEIGSEPSISKSICELICYYVSMPKFWSIVLDDTVLVFYFPGDSLIGDSYFLAKASSSKASISYFRHSFSKALNMKRTVDKDEQK